VVERFLVVFLSEKITWTRGCATQSGIRTRMQNACLSEVIVTTNTHRKSRNFFPLPPFFERLQKFTKNITFSQTKNGLFALLVSLAKQD